MQKAQNTDHELGLLTNFQQVYHKIRQELGEVHKKQVGV